jgi:glycerophosphoryl diester phosphodiesterase
VDFPSEQLPLVVAHRGASATSPENTAEAFEAAVAAGAPAIEFDVRLSVDGVPVVVHDSDVARIAGAQGLVHELTLEELRRLDVAGGGIPTLREVLDLLSGRAGLDIEIKNIPGEPAFDSPREAALEGCLRELEASAFSGPVLVSSFNWTTIERCRELAPDVPTGFLTIAAMDPRAALAYARDGGHRWVLPQVDAVLEAGAGFVAEAHAAGLLTGTWVVDDEEAMARLFDMGLDAVATNDPTVGMRVRSRYLSRYP